jgi:hypothetical protein
MQRRILSFAAALAASVMTLQAHHSIAGAYDTNRQVKLEGTVAEFHFVNPHPFVTVQVNNDDGSAQQWRLEMDNRSELSEVGMHKDTLKAGDRIVVSGNPAAAQALGLYIRRLDRPADGFRYEQVGNSPRINFKPR